MKPLSSIPFSERTSHQLLIDAVEAMDLLVEAPRIVTAAGVALEDRKEIALRMLQNVGTNAVLILVTAADPDTGAIPNPTLLNYHFSLAAGTAADDGLGGTIDLSRVRGIITAAGADGNAFRLVTFQARRAN